MTVQKESTAKLQGVPETLMITLYGRYTEQSYPDCILKDEKAVEIAEKVDYDFSKYAQEWVSQVTSVIRSRIIDNLLKKFIILFYISFNPFCTKISLTDRQTGMT